MFELFMIIGFGLAAFSAIANDSIQTLGTFLSSNSKRPWWLLWIWISGIMFFTIMYGWSINECDPAFGRLAAGDKNIPHPLDVNVNFSWIYIIPPLVLVCLTKSGIPVSTTVLLLTSFSGILAHQTGGDISATAIFLKMMEKSIVGYLLAFIIGLALFNFILFKIERKVLKQSLLNKNSFNWTIFQWLSTGFLWSMWLIQDLANIFVYLPRQLSFTHMLLALTSMVLLQGYIIKTKGGKIQKIVTSKTNTINVRSASLIDFSYGLILLFFKFDYIPVWFSTMGWDIPWPANMPMSTTWVFLGLIAGREIGIAINLRHRNKKEVTRLVLGDLGKATIGATVAILIALLLPLIPLKFF